MFAIRAVAFPSHLFQTGALTEAQCPPGSLTSKQALTGEQREAPAAPASPSLQLPLPGTHCHLSVTAASASREWESEGKRAQLSAASTSIALLLPDSKSPAPPRRLMIPISGVSVVQAVIQGAGGMW